MTSNLMLHFRLNDEKGIEQQMKEMGARYFFFGNPAHEIFYF